MNSHCRGCKGALATSSALGRRETPLREATKAFARRTPASWQSRRAVELRFITPADALYTQELELRYRVLREPLGMSRADVLFPFEAQCLHLVALDPSGVAGCVLFHQEAATSGRLLQMAVEPALQRRGVGQEMVRTLEAELRKRGVVEVHLHARENAVPFYERLGYRVFGEPFMDVSVPHRSMRRIL
jgi:ribosomal protein S18 acetylase RimI-like enzyme